MKWQIVLEVQLRGSPDDVEGLLDQVMTDLVDADVEDPGIGVSSNPGIAEIEFVVDGPATLDEAHRLAQDIMAKTALQLPEGGTLVGESTRKAELVPA
ncbi:MAG TPA: hypothetical protein VGF87_01490 [Acidimicrobiales bacterium]|jgi:hypothetical protein